MPISYPAKFPWISSRKQCFYKPPCWSKKLFSKGSTNWASTPPHGVFVVGVEIPPFALSTSKVAWISSVLNKMEVKGVWDRQGSGRLKIKLLPPSEEATITNRLLPDNGISTKTRKLSLLP